MIHMHTPRINIIRKLPERTIIQKMREVDQGLEDLLEERSIHGHRKVDPSILKKFRTRHDRDTRKLYIFYIYLYIIYKNILLKPNERIHNNTI